VSTQASDGTWIHPQVKTVITCDRCGRVDEVYGMNDRGVDAAIAKHARENHGGLASRWVKV
jgi:hypothetical protein